LVFIFIFIFFISFFSFLLSKYYFSSSILIFYILDANIVHGDLKTQNIFIDTTNTPERFHIVVADFGVSQVVGTPSRITHQVKTKIIGLSPPYTGKNKNTSLISFFPFFFFPCKKINLDKNSSL